MAFRVLVVEDSEDQRRLLAWLLRAAGLESVLAWNAELALAILENRECDAAVFDVRLPGTNGLAALSVITRKRPTLPVLLVTASGGLREARTRALGTRGILREPFSAGEFLTAVREVLASNGNWGVS